MAADARWRRRRRTGHHRSLLTLPKFSVREVEVDHVIPRDVTVPNIITKDVEIAIPRIVALTPTEKRFLDSREYQAAPMHGRIVSPRSERALSFDDGSDYTPTLPDMAADAAPLLGCGDIVPQPATRRSFTALLFCTMER